MRIGLISDTHGLLRPEALDALRDSDAIIHAGDIGRPDIIPALRDIAPVTAIRGNVDTAEWARAYPATDILALDDGTLIYTLHDINDLDLDPFAAGIRVVVSGHSHKPGIREKDGVLHVNPGSAGPRRFSLPVTVGRLVIDGSGSSAEIIELQVHAAS